MKLFKKVMASVLAGVLALSMVACGPASVVPPTDEIPTTPTASAEDNVLAAVNFMRNDNYGHFVNAVQVKQGNAARTALAQTIADLLSADPNRDTETAVWTREGKVYVPLATINSVMNRKGFIYTNGAEPKNDHEYNVEGIFVVANDQIVKINAVDIVAVAPDSIDKEVTCLSFTVAQVQKSVYGSYAKQQLANVGYLMGSQPTDIGIAQVKTNGNAIVLVSTENLAAAPAADLDHVVGGNGNIA